MALGQQRAVVLDLLAEELAIAQAQQALVHADAIAAAEQLRLFQR